VRSALSTLEVLRPRTLREALRMLSANGARPTPLAGGTDLFVYLNAGTEQATRFLDLSRLAELRGIRVGAREATLGARTTFWEIRRHAALGARLPSLAAAASEIGAWQIQHRATIGGNIANASPAGDSLPALLAHDARVRVASRGGEREIPFDALYTGYRKLAIAPDELVTAVVIPFPPRGSLPFFRKVGTRRAQSISKVVFCGLLACDRRGRAVHARLAYGSMAPTPARARAAEDVLLAGATPQLAAAAARAALGQDLTPIDDIRSDRGYRLQVAGNLLEQFVRSLPAARR